jgi:single-strand DNA-binding protein
MAAGVFSLYANKNIFHQKENQIMLKITAIGNLTAEPEMRENRTTGTQYAIMRIASDRRYRNQNGEKYTDFISIKVFSPLAERCVEHLRKSDKIAANGDFETIVTTRNGYTNTGFLIKANEVEFLSPRRRDTEEHQPDEAPDEVKSLTEMSIEDPIEDYPELEEAAGSDSDVA